MHTDACMSVDIVTSVTLRNLHHHCDLVYMIWVVWVYPWAPCDHQTTDHLTCILAWADHRPPSPCYLDNCCEVALITVQSVDTVDTVATIIIMLPSRHSAVSTHNDAYSTPLVSQHCKYTD